MFAIVLIVFVSIGLAVLFATLLPGAGLIGSAIVIAGGIALAAWLLASGASRRAPSEIIRDTDNPELLGPGGPDDPGRQ